LFFELNNELGIVIHNCDPSYSEDGLGGLQFKASPGKK
jgi:hypothetical protein